MIPKVESGSWDITKYGKPDGARIFFRLSNGKFPERTVWSIFITAHARTTQAD